MARSNLSWTEHEEAGGSDKVSSFEYKLHSSRNNLNLRAEVDWASPQHDSHMRLITAVEDQIEAMFDTHQVKRTDATYLLRVAHRFGFLDYAIRNTQKYSAAHNCAAFASRASSVHNALYQRDDRNRAFDRMCSFTMDVAHADFFEDLLMIVASHHRTRIIENPHRAASALDVVVEDDNVSGLTSCEYHGTW